MAKAANKPTESEEDEKNFRFASSLIKVIAVVIALMVLVISRYAFTFFASGMLPTIFAIFFDRNSHKCLSATICSFNLIGVIPFLVRMWSTSSVDHMAKQILADLNTWMIIYGSAFVGLMIYITLPMLVVKLYSAKMQVQVNKLEQQHSKICEEWGIETKK
jgi:hypothetical protein